MRKILSFFICISLAIVVFAQSQFNSYVLNGDVMMRQQMYEMALDYYNKALSVANNASESSHAQGKIKICKEIIAAAADPQQKQGPAKSSVKLVFKDEYLETGDLYQKETGKVVESEYDHVLSLFSMEVYTTYLKIVNHIDVETEEELSDAPSGAIYKVSKEAKEYRIYSSVDGDEYFIIFKKAEKNKYGTFRLARHVIDGECYVLYSTAELKEMMADEEAEEETVKENVAEPAPVKEKTHIPFTFGDSWALNIDEDGNRMGDSRSEPLVAAKVCWLLIRSRYSCPDSFDRKLVFDVKVYSPSNSLVQLSGKNVKKDYSTNVMLETIPGGGILNFAFGQNEPGYFKKGKYRIEFWYDGTMYHSVDVVLK